jgi:hypothetical protein
MCSEANPKVYGQRRCLVAVLTASCVIKGQGYLPFSSRWKLPGHDIDSTQRVELLIGLPHGSWSYPEPFAHGLDVIRDRHIIT